MGNRLRSADTGACSTSPLGDEHDVRTSNDYGDTQILAR